MAIKVLPEHIANQIAAGEVVEGPVSVIKELVENSIDAGASKIIVAVKNNFLCIQVTDNGSGIAVEDMELAFKKHATSKLESWEDIYALVTNGFRGEALPSIASVSRLTCVSKTAEAEHASKMVIQDGKSELGLTGAGQGTSITVEDLFYNTPARLKFLKTNNKLRQEVIDVVRAFALANVAVAFELSLDDKLVCKSSGSGDLQSCIAEVLKLETGEQFIPVDFSRGDLEIKGYVSNLALTRSDKRGIFTFVNGRILDCYILRSGIESVYRELLAPKKYPIVVLNMSLPQDQVDVNVHPNKKQVKYQNSNFVYNSVADAVAAALSNNRYKSQASFQPSFQDYQHHRHHSESSKMESESSSSGKLDPFVSLQDDGASLQGDKTLLQSKIFKDSLNFEKSDFKFSVEEDVGLSFNSQKFLSRLGAVDIRLVARGTARTMVETQGNKTIFDLVIDSNNSDEAALLRGEFIGEDWLKEKYFDLLDKLGKEILQREKDKQNFGSKKQASNKNRPNKKPKQSLLDKIWQRDNYTCVYCAKKLLHPDLVKDNLGSCSDPAKLNEHVASYDHHLPASKFPELNESEDNLYASCQECNKKKSDSLASETWKPRRADAWDKITQKEWLTENFETA